MSHSRPVETIRPGWWTTPPFYPEYRRVRFARTVRFVRKLTQSPNGFVWSEANSRLRARSSGRTSAGSTCCKPIRIKCLRPGIGQIGFVRGAARPGWPERSDRRPDRPEGWLVPSILSRHRSCPKSQWVRFARRDSVRSARGFHANRSSPILPINFIFTRSCYDQIRSKVEHK